MNMLLVRIVYLNFIYFVTCRIPSINHVNITKCLENIIENNFKEINPLLFILNDSKYSLENVINSRKMYSYQPQIIEETDIILQGNHWLSSKLLYNFGHNKKILVITHGNVTIETKKILQNLWLQRKTKLGN